MPVLKQAVVFTRTIPRTKEYQSGSQLKTPGNQRAHVHPPSFFFAAPHIAKVKEFFLRGSRTFNSKIGFPF